MVVDDKSRTVEARNGKVGYVEVKHMVCLDKL